MKNSAEKPPPSNFKLSSLCCPRDLLAFQRERTPGVVAIGATEVTSQLWHHRFIERFDPERGHDLGTQAQEVCCSTTLINGRHRKHTKEAICL